ncbi:hypothetical protein HanRHA438_Chr10g0478651 [Helianthus annuus]|nr:hypothetical protein HanHA300_Chr10g0381711 [Helianthus annuus]KAJ0531731.1 hypothetical protein HanHA89_Chr10g0404181 [Helianthus annuus]KAJ0701927.1 hypothetical protein HanOQP8_Chr10g0384661 [Helianthus annuus]KAJ0881849.1 hypothetical protein HanRHA438_Chr10g0478651 [Helianthus annuus]
MAAASASFTGSVFKSNRISTNSAISAGVRTVAFNANTASSVQLQRSLSYSQCRSKVSLASSGQKGAEDLNQNNEELRTNL